MSDDTDQLLNASEALWQLLLFIWGVSPIGVTFVLFIALAWAVLEGWQRL